MAITQKNFYSTGKTGLLENLNTTEKSTFVGAINELEDRKITFTDPLNDGHIKVLGDNSATVDEEIIEQFTEIGGEFDILKENLRDNNVYNLVDDMPTYNYSYNGVSFTWNGSSCRVSGTSTTIVFNNMFLSGTSLPEGMKAGERYYVHFNGTNVRLYIYDYSNTTLGNTLFDSYYSKDGGSFKLPDSCNGLIIRIWVDNGTTLDETVTPIISKNPSYFTDYVERSAEPYVTNNTITLSDIKQTGRYIIDETWTITDKPSNTGSANCFVLIVERNHYTYPYSFMSQKLISIGGTVGQNFYRISNGNWNYSSWMPITPSNVALPNNSDLNDYTGIENERAYVIVDSNTYYNCPVNIGILFVYQVVNVTLQIIYPWFGGGFWKRRMIAGQNWEEWSRFDSDDFYSKGYFTSDTDLNNVVDSGFYLLTDSYTYTNLPTPGIGFLIVYKIANTVLQLFYSWEGGNVYKRRKINSTWEQWRQSGGGSTTNNYNFNEYSQTLTVNATPTITTDTNNYLASTGDTTDRTAAILSLLNNGCCNLGPGEFYVSGINMPNNSILCGCGESTVIKLIGTSDGYAIKMNWYNNVQNLKIDGQSDQSSTVGGRHGILWQGNYTETHDGYSADVPREGRVNNVHIVNFSGGGITCYDTGYNIFNNINVVNCMIENCSAGINISYWSEFNKFTNVQCRLCYYGCINNGGNNTFVNCDFSENKEIAMLMDNSQDQSPNNTHGSCVCCVFNHTAHNGTSNTGIGIKILNCQSGFVFTGCQIFFSQIYIEDTDGITVSDCNFGLNNCNITVKNGGAVLFANNMHQGAPTITITNNNNVHFVNCYNRSTGAVITA